MRAIGHRGMLLIFAVWIIAQLQSVYACAWVPEGNDAVNGPAGISGGTGAGAGREPASGSGPLTSAAGPRPPPKTGGGPCEYKTYTGQAEIISISPIDLPTGYPGPPHDSYEVQFVFSPDQPITEPHGRIQGKPQILKLANSWYPGPRFLQKYDIAQGRVFACHLKVITRGSCSPRRFEFPAIDLEDYFESQKRQEGGVKNLSAGSESRCG